MPFKGNRIYIIAGILVLLAFIALAIAASGQQPRKIGTGGSDKIYVCIVNTDIGVQQIKIINQNTGTSIIKTAADLPYSFYFSDGDTLNFNVTVIDGYVWNAWEINQWPWFDNHNPLTLKPDTDVELTPKCLVEEVK